MKVVHVVLVEAMAEVQALGKPQDVKNCCDLEKCFADYIMQKYKDSDQL